MPSPPKELFFIQGCGVARYSVVCNLEGEVLPVKSVFLIVRQVTVKSKFGIGSLRKRVEFAGAVRGPPPYLTDIDSLG